MATINLLYKSEYRINDYISVRIPSVGEVLAQEDDYYALVSLLTAVPIDYMVQLDDAGVDFTSLNDWELFICLFPALLGHDTSLVFGDLDMSRFQPVFNPQNNTVMLFDKTSGAKIDRAIHGQIAAVLRKIHHMERNNKKPANGEAREFMLRRAREKMKRRSRRNEDSQLESLIIALVNTEQFSYKYSEVLDMSIYQFNESVRQIIKKIDYEHRMHGVYSGTVNAKELSQEDLNWLIHK